jgi:DNA-binding response OmpR family regulator
MTSRECSVLQRALSSRCGVVDCAASVEAARPLIQRNLYDLVVLDIALPGCSGIDWLHERARTVTPATWC